MDFLRCISICHECVTVKHKTHKDKLCYNGSSVDEVALHHMAQEAGIGYFTERDANTFTVKIEGFAEKYELIKIFEFDSVRKAMSVLVKHPEEEGKAILFVKGADSSVLNMCLPTKDTE